MIKQLLAVILALCILGITACSSNRQTETSSVGLSLEANSQSENTVPGVLSCNSSDISNQTQEIPSLTVTVEGESVLLVDMNEPLVRNFFAGCDGYDVDSLDIIVSSMETRQETPGHIDPRYTYPMYSLDKGEYEGTYLELAEKLLGWRKNGGACCECRVYPPVGGYFV